MNTSSQTISRKGLQVLRNLPGICQSYKLLINRYASADLLADEFDISNEDIEKAFKDANPEQKKALSTYFKQTDKIVDFLKIKDFEKLISIYATSERVPPSLKAERSMRAYQKILHIANIYNEGWEPDFKDSTYKYFIYKYYSGGRWSAVVDVHYDSAFQPSGVYFKSRELAQAALDNFPEICNDYFMI